MTYWCNSRIFNIDLYHQGVYYLRAQIYIPGEGAKPNPTRGSLDKNKKEEKKRNSSKSNASQNSAGDNGSNALNGNIDDDYEKRAMHEIRPK